MVADGEFVEIGGPIPRLAWATAGKGRTVEAAWTSGERITIDLTPLIATHSAFRRLRSDDDFFRALQVEPLGRSIYWPDDTACEIPTAYLSEHAVQA